MRAEVSTRHIRVYLDLNSGELGWAEYSGDLTGDVTASGRYVSSESLESLYARALSDARLKVDESEWWNGDSIAMSGPAEHPLMAAAR